MLAERVKEWKRQWEKEGRLEEGQAYLFRILLTFAFGELPGWVEDRLAQATTEQLEHWAEQIPDAKTIEEVFD